MALDDVFFLSTCFFPYFKQASVAQNGMIHVIRRPCPPMHAAMHSLSFWARTRERCQSHGADLQFFSSRRPNCCIKVSLLPRKLCGWYNLANQAWLDTPASVCASIASPDTVCGCQTVCSLLIRPCPLVIDPSKSLRHLVALSQFVCVEWIWLNSNSFIGLTGLRRRGDKCISRTKLVSQWKSLICWFKAWEKRSVL